MVKIDYAPPDDAALSQLRHLILTEMETCPDSEYKGFERAIEILDEYREKLERERNRVLCSEQNS